MRYFGLPLLLVMNWYGRPGFAQSSAMGVATLPPPTIAASAAPTSSVVPSVLYPVGNPILNNIDTLEVNYITPWESVDMIVSCGTTAEEPDSFSFKTDNLPQNGPYGLELIEQSFRTTTYPLHCQITLEDFSDSDNIINAVSFIMTSTGGSPSLYAQATTAVIAASTSNTARTGTTKPSSTTTRSTRTTPATSNPTVDSAAASASTSSDSSTSPSSSQNKSGLSPGAKAGIALSIILFLALLALFIFLFLRYRRAQRHLHDTQSQLVETQASAAAAVAAHANEKAYLDSILTAAGKPDTSSGGRIVVADLGSRQSGDWRSFFAAKANSARQAISNVGSRPASRSGSRRASIFGSRGSSRPGTSAGDDIPNVPNLPSPSSVGRDDSVVGEGSTVGLVSGSEEKKVPGVKRKPLPVHKAGS